MPSFPFTILDVFTVRPLEGNQLAVFADGAAVPDELVQALAKEIGFSETVYVFSATDVDDADARLRIFTPETELPFAGHPVLGTAIALAGERGLSTVRLETGAGIVPVSQVEGRWWMHQPIPTWAPFDDAAALLAALGPARSELPVEVYDNGGVRHAYVVAESEGLVAGLTPDLRQLASIAGRMGASCVAGSGDTWKTRMFAPGAGVAEDPATGSAAGPLAVHLARHGLIGWGEEITISQGVEIGRPSTLYAFARGSDNGVESVEVGGQAVIVGRGEFTL
ncbi:MAG: PhzF family phenazine biosynthesis protein [Acidimicrobiales bacterium]